jgi:hypothetical protein
MMMVAAAVLYYVTIYAFVIHHCFQDTEVRQSLNIAVHRRFIYIFAVG